MATVSVTTGTGSATVSVSTGARGPAGSDATVTAAAVTAVLGDNAAPNRTALGLGTAATTAATSYATAAQGSTADSALQPADIASGTITPYVGNLDFSGGLGGTTTPTNNLGRFRRLLSETPFPKPSIFLFGDSMIGTSSTAMLAALQNTFGSSGQNMDAAVSGGAAALNDSCNYWLNGTTYPITASGHTVTLGTSGGTFAVTGNVLKIYYVVEPGAGTFQVQISENSGAWTNEGAVVDANGTLAGGIWTVTKTTWRANYRMRCVWVSGSTKIIGGRVEDTTRRGGKYFFVSNGSSAINNLDNAAANTPAAIVNPIMADIAPNLCIMSHLDGAVAVNSYQSTVQDKITAGVASPPSWLIVGAPTSAVSEAQDTLNGEQAEAQRLLALSRFDAFFDNRLWALPWSTAEARGLFSGGDQVHYAGLAQDQWIPAMISELGVDKARVFGPAKVEEMTIGSRKLTYGSGGTLDLDGSIRVHGSSSGLLCEDRTSPANTNDFGGIFYDSNVVYVYGAGAGRWAFNGSVGQANFYPNGSTAATPNGDLGLVAFPWRSLNVSKKVNTNATVGNVTADTVAGRVWFDVGSSSITITNARCAADSVVTASVLGSDATATSVRVQTVSAGSFVLTLNAAATAKTEVSFFLIP